MRRTFLLSILLCVVAIPMIAASGKVTGSMTVNGKKTEFHHVVAVAAPSMFFKDERQDLVVVLSDVPVTASEVVGRELTSRWMDGKLSALLLRIQPWDKQVVSGNLWAGNLAKEGRQISGNGMAEFQPTKFDAKEVDARVYQKKYGDSDLWMTVDATFSAPIEGGTLDFTSPEPPAPAEQKLQGKALPANGGEPGAAYMAFVKALHANNVAAMKKYLTAPLSAGSTAELKEVLPMMQEMAPKDSKIQGGVSDGTNAELNITTSSGKGTVRMVHEKDGWKFNGVRP